MKFLLSLSLVFLLGSTTWIQAAGMQQRVQDATEILAKRQGSVNPIPAEILAHAKGVAICTITKAGIGIGGQGGEGILLVKHFPPNGPFVWRAPSAFNISGGSFGAQIGVSIIRYIIILNSEEAIGQFVGEGKMKWDATATGTAGDDTGVESESTRNLEQRAVIVYRDSGGIFGGATFGGSSVEVKNEINQAAYGQNVFVRDILEGKVQPPAYAQHLYALLDGKR